MLELEASKSKQAKIEEERKDFSETTKATKPTWQVTTQSAQGPPPPPLVRRTRKTKAADVDVETRRGVAEKLRVMSPAPEQSGATARSRATMGSSGGAAPQLFHTMLSCA